MKPGPQDSAGFCDDEGAQVTGGGGINVHPLVSVPPTDEAGAPVAPLGQVTYVVVYIVPVYPAGQAVGEFGYEPAVQLEPVPPVVDDELDFGFGANVNARCVQVLSSQTPDSTFTLDWSF